MLKELCPRHTMERGESRTPPTANSHPAPPRVPPRPHTWGGCPPAARRLHMVITSMRLQWRRAHLEHLAVRTAEHDEESRKLSAWKAPVKAARRRSSGRPAAQKLQDA